MSEIDYGTVLIAGGRLKGRIMYYDDQEGRTAICYAGHPLHFPRTYDVPIRFLKEPVVDDLLTRSEKIAHALNLFSINKNWPENPADLHDLWAERTLITEELFSMRLLGQVEHPPGEKTVFLCHASSDKGLVRRINDDLRRLGVKTWIDENNIKVGESIVGKISDTLNETQVMIVFMSETSNSSLWTTKEWQSFLSRQLSGSRIKILPALIEECGVPSILSDVKYANFTSDYREGLHELLAALG